MKTKKTIALFGGSFDPIHLGHIAMAVDFVERYQFDTLYFCPAKKNPLKQQSPYASENERLEMIREAIRGIPHLALLDIELKRTSPSYTIETLIELKKFYEQKGEETDLYLILGEDSASTFCHWRKPEEIIKLAILLVGCRGLERDRVGLEASGDVKRALENAFVHTRLFEVSSSEIRQRIAEGKMVHHLLPNGVTQYIYSKGLYVHD